VPAPKLTGQSLGAVQHRGSHLQIIASAGAGKTEVVSQRVVSLLSEGIDGREIVAFTFSKKAAEELKDRIVERVQETLGSDGLAKISGLFVGTIHAYSFRILQQMVPRYETFDVLDENQLTGFLSRESNRLKLKELSPKSGKFHGIDLFRANADVVENELLDINELEDPFKSTYIMYLETLDRYRLMSYGLQIARAVQELRNPGVRERIVGSLRHLIVDEYQDVNFAQESLIQLLTGPDTELCVVGDDDQAIYQWRGSNVENILTFRTRYKNVKTFSIEENRRSRPQIVDVANAFAKSIPDRLPKKMVPTRASAGGESEVAVWTCPTEDDEVGYIVQHILNLNSRGVRYSDIAILVRASTSYPMLLERLSMFDIPVQPAGRVGLFEQPQARVLGQAFFWLVDEEWREKHGGGATSIQLGVLLSDFTKVFGLSTPQRKDLETTLKALKREVPNEKRTADLVGEYYTILESLGVRSWDLSVPMIANQAGTLARFGALLADYEMVYRRSRPDAEAAGEQVGGTDRGAWFYRNFVRLVSNYALKEFDDFGGEDDHGLDAVALTTVHSAKGLEWPVVFIPSITKSRFPSRNTGKAGHWLVPETLFDRDRYEGSESDERRLFYVALTRARDWVGISRHERVTTKSSGLSPFFEHLQTQGLEIRPEVVTPSPIETRPSGADVLTISFSEVAAFMECGHSYRLRQRLGFPVRFAAELGYGKAVHHILRTVAEEVKATGKVPKPADIDQILDSSFFLPAANKVGHREMKRAARDLVNTYVKKHKQDLFRIWETERPFELRLDGVNIVGRADVILDQEGGVPTGLAIVDYKTSTKRDLADHDLQLQVYAIAGQREGLDIRGAYVHDLKLSDRTTVSIGKGSLASAVETVQAAAVDIKLRRFKANPGNRCRSCEVRSVCGNAKH